MLADRLKIGDTIDVNIKDRLKKLEIYKKESIYE